MDEQTRREWMVEMQVARRGVTDERVLAAMCKVPRHRFLPPESQELAYADCALRVDEGQSISQPFIVGLMLALLEVLPEHKVLDVGTGSGYQAALLGELAGEVHTVERLPGLAQKAAAVLRELGYAHVQVHIDDGSLGYPPAAPFDRIIVGAGAPSVPPALLEQTEPSGRLVIPVGGRHSQDLEVWERQQDQWERVVNLPVVFVPLVGAAGWGA